MENLVEIKFRYNNRKLPPAPPNISGELLQKWQKNWRSLYKWFRYQMSDDARYWLAVSEALGPEATEKLLGPEALFKIDNLPCISGDDDLL